MCGLVKLFVNINSDARGSKQTTVSTRKKSLKIKMEKKEFWMKLRDEDLTEETETLISSLPSERVPRSKPLQVPRFLVLLQISPRGSQFPERF